MPEAQVDNSTQTQIPRLTKREYLVIFLLIAVPFAFTCQLYEQLPAKVTSIMGVGADDGAPLPRERHLLLALGLQLYMVIIYLYVLNISSRAIFFRAGDRPDVWKLSGDMYYLTHHFMAAIFYPIILLMGMIGPLELLKTAGVDGGTLLRGMIIGVAVLNVCILLAAVTFVVRYSRINRKLSVMRGASPASDPRERQYWRLLGCVYVNRDNPALWVDKRWGAGWTINFGHPQAKKETYRLLAVALLPLAVIFGIIYF